MKLSIIVPMYNVEHYLRQCLDSIYKLGRIEKEVILVNDGSKDGTLEIAKEYGAKPIYFTVTEYFISTKKGLK